MSILNRFRRTGGRQKQAESITPVDPATLGFGVGDIVRDVWGNEHTVTEIDPQAEHGLGLIWTRRLSDGVMLGAAMMAHGLALARKADECHHDGPEDMLPSLGYKRTDRPNLRQVSVLFLSVFIIGHLFSSIDGCREQNYARTFQCDGVVTSVRRSSNHNQLVIEVRNDDGSLSQIESWKITLNETEIHKEDRLTKAKGSSDCRINNREFRFCD